MNKQINLLTHWEDGTIRVKDTRLLIDSIIYAHQQGESPEDVFESFPSKEYTVADIYLIVAFYLQNKTEIDKYLAKREKEAEKIRNKIESASGYIEQRDELRKKLLERWEERKKGEVWANPDTLKKYNFKHLDGRSLDEFPLYEILKNVDSFFDEHGHPLKTCVDFQELLRERGVSAD